MKQEEIDEIMKDPNIRIPVQEEIDNMVSLINNDVLKADTNPPSPIREETVHELLLSTIESRLNLYIGKEVFIDVDGETKELKVSEFHIDSTALKVELMDKDICFGSYRVEEIKEL